MKTRTVLSALAVFGIAGVASANQSVTTTYSAVIPVPIPIPDNQPNGPGIAVNIVVPDAGSIEDVNVSLGLTHTWYGDLNIELDHSGLTNDILNPATPDDSTNVGGTYVVDDEAATTWDAAALALPSSTSTIASGSYRGDEALSEFDGQNLLGIWTLRIRDHVGADVGTLSSFQLIITYKVPAPGALALLGVAGLVGSRRRRA